MFEDSTSGTTDVVMPVGDLEGRTVWTDAGSRLGTVSSVETDDDGTIIALEVRERWFFGGRHTVMARGMRLDSGDVIVPAEAALEMRTREVRPRRDESATSVASRTAAPVFVAGREGARSRFGGLDIVGSFFGGLVIVASVVLIGGVLAAIFGTGDVNFDTSLGSFSDATSQTLLVGGATLLLASLLGGWAAGRGSRFDGAGNGLAAVVWALALGVAFGALGAWAGNQYDVYAKNSSLPHFTTDHYSTWGIIVFAAAFLLMLIGGAVGGLIGERWHRRVDRAMLDVVSLDQSVAPSTMVGAGSPVAPQPFEDTGMVEGTDAGGNPLA